MKTIKYPKHEKILGIRIPHRVLLTIYGFLNAIAGYLIAYLIHGA